MCSITPVDNRWSYPISLLSARKVLLILKKMKYQIIQYKNETQFFLSNDIFNFTQVWLLCNFSQHWVKAFLD